MSNTKPTVDPKTIEVYGREAAKYAKRDRSERAGGFLEPFIGKMPVGGTILDLGCGSGWAGAIMEDRSLDVHALDACPEFVALAQQRLKRPVKVAAIEDVDDVEMYDGIWASAVLLHVPKAGLPELLGRLGRALKPGGLLMATFKAGTGESRDRLGRFYAYYSFDDLKALVEAVPGLEWEGHLDATGHDFAGNRNMVYAIMARKSGR